jgi:Lar family restriction alleviation protein
MSDKDLGRCDKKQYEHAGLHQRVGEYGQSLPPFPCENWKAEPSAPPSEGPLLIEGEFTLEDYMQAPSGIGPLAFTWKDKPHRLVYDLVKVLRAASSGQAGAGPRALKPCPFCGSENVMLDNLIDEDAYDDYFVSCRGCEVQQIANYKADVAVQRWNSRFPAEPAAQPGATIEKPKYPCPVCGGISVDTSSSDPGQMPIALPIPKSNGKWTNYHLKCVMKSLALSAPKAPAGQPEKWPQHCDLCNTDMESADDRTEWHGLGNCFPICDRCTGSGIDPEPSSRTLTITPTGAPAPAPLDLEKLLVDLAEAIRHKQRVTNKYRDNELLPLLRQVAARHMGSGEGVTE